MDDTLIKSVLAALRTRKKFKNIDNEYFNKLRDDIDSMLLSVGVTSPTAFEATHDLTRSDN